MSDPVHLGQLGDDELRVLVDRHLPSLRAFIRLRMGDALAARETSLDLVQSVFRELVSEGDGFELRGDAAFRGWLYTTAVRKILQKARLHGAQQRDPRREQPLDSPQALLELANSLTPSREAAAKEEVQRVEAAFETLDDSDREIISLIKIAGLTHAQIADRRNITVEASRTKLRRALVRLAAALDHRPLAEPHHHEPSPSGDPN